MNEIKEPGDIGYITVTSVLTFDDLVDQFRMERFQQISVPIHQVKLFQKSEVIGKVNGSLLARSNLGPLFQQTYAKVAAH